MGDGLDGGRGLTAQATLLINPASVGNRIESLASARESEGGTPSMLASTMHVPHSNPYPLHYFPPAGAYHAPHIPIDRSLELAAGPRGAPLAGGAPAGVAHVFFPWGGAAVWSSAGLLSRSCACKFKGMMAPRRD